MTDILMCEKDGIDTIREIYRFKQDHPIIAISGGFTQHPFDLLTIAKRFGATSVLPKTGFPARTESRDRPFPQTPPF
jgi:hypothetical protein